MDHQRTPSNIESIPEDSSVEVEDSPAPPSPSKDSSSSSSLSKEHAPNNVRFSQSGPPPSSTFTASGFSRSLPAKQLSVTSERYDVGNKGFLTPAEQTMRDMDTHGEGQLTNEQVSRIVEQTMSLRDMNSRLRFWVLALFGAVIVLALSNLGTAFAAARLAKDTSVSESTGVMMVKGKDTPVVILSQGSSVRAIRVTLPNGETTICMYYGEAARLMNRTMAGTKTTIIIEDLDGGEVSAVETVGLSPTGTLYGGTTSDACFGRDDGSSPMCTNFGNRCHEVVTPTGRRSLAVSRGPPPRDASHPSHPIHSFHRWVQNGGYVRPTVEKRTSRRLLDRRLTPDCNSPAAKSARCNHDNYANAWDQEDCDNGSNCDASSSTGTPLSANCLAEDGWAWDQWYCYWTGDNTPNGPYGEWTQGNDGTSAPTEAPTATP